MFARGGQFYYRRRVPTDVRKLTGQIEIWRSMRTDSLRVALRRFPFVAANVEAGFAAARSKAGSTVHETLLMPVGDDARSIFARPVASEDCRSAISARAITPTFGDAYEKYLRDPTHNWSTRTREAYETSRKIAVDVIGAEISLAMISRARCRDYIEVLRFLPRNAKKRFPKLTISEASALARNHANPDVMSSANANVHLSNLSNFLNWAVNEELIARNPARGLRLPDEIAKRDKRYPFSGDQLKAIIAADQQAASPKP
ncbi:MAG: DUF6538 domain-containing protein [Sphingomonas sp.]